MASYRLNREVFKAHTIKEASNHSVFYKNLDWQERLRITAYLNSIAYDYPEDMPPRMDKTKFKVHSRAL
jgi:hypothetical protein